MKAPSRVKLLAEFEVFDQIMGRHGDLQPPVLLSLLAAAGAYLTPIIYSSGQGQATYAEQCPKEYRYRPT